MSFYVFLYCVMFWFLLFHFSLFGYYSSCYSFFIRFFIRLFSFHTSFLLYVRLSFFSFLVRSFFIYVIASFCLFSIRLFINFAVFFSMRCFCLSIFSVPISLSLYLPCHPRGSRCARAVFRFSRSLSAFLDFMAAEQAVVSTHQRATSNGFQPEGDFLLHLPLVYPFVFLLPCRETLAAASTISLSESFTLPI